MIFAAILVYFAKNHLIEKDGYAGFGIGAAAEIFGELMIFLTWLIKFKC